VKLLTDECVFVSDSTAFTSYTPEQLIALEARAFAAWLPKIAHVHALAFHFRTSLLDLALEANTSAYALTRKEITILIVEENGALRAEHVAVARAAAPNATILCAGCYVVARDQTLQREAAGSPVHLVLAGECVDEGVPLSDSVRVRAVKHYMRAVDPRKGDVHTDMRDRPLIAAISGCAQPAVCAKLFRLGLDAALPGGRVTTAALLTLLDFICERQLGECSSTEPRVPTPVADRIVFDSERTDEEPLAVAAAEADSEPPLSYVKRPPVPTPIAPRFIMAEAVSRPRSRRASSQLQLATIGDGGGEIPPTQLTHAAHAPLTPLPNFLRWQSRAATPPSNGSLRKSFSSMSCVTHPTFPPPSYTRAASLSSPATFSQTAQLKPVGGSGQGITPVLSSTAYLKGTVQPAAAPGQFAQIGLAPISSSMAVLAVLPAGGAEQFAQPCNDPISPPKPVSRLSSIPNPTGAAHVSSLPQLFDRGGLSRPMPRALS